MRQASIPTSEYKLVIVIVLHICEVVNSEVIKTISFYFILTSLVCKEHATKMTKHNITYNTSEFLKND